jgi:hypothetical protein
MIMNIQDFQARAGDKQAAQLELPTGCAPEQKKYLGRLREVACSKKSGAVLRPV